MPDLARATTLSNTNGTWKVWSNGPTLITFLDRLRLDLSGFDHRHCGPLALAQPCRTAQLHA
jgi:hypothetical protein